MSTLVPVDFFSRCWNGLATSLEKSTLSIYRGCWQTGLPLDDLQYQLILYLVHSTRFVQHCVTRAILLRSRSDSFRGEEYFNPGEKGSDNSFRQRFSKRGGAYSNSGSKDLPGIPGREVTGTPGESAMLALTDRRTAGADLALIIAFIRWKIQFISEKCCLCGRLQA